MAEVKAEFPIGKTQWAKWSDEARKAYNRMRNLGFTHETGVAEGNAVQAKARKAAPEEEVKETASEQPAPEQPAPKQPASNPKPRTIKRKQGK